MPSPWVTRAQRNELPSKSHDIYAPSVEVANDIRFSARIGTLTITASPEWTDAEVASHDKWQSQPCDGPEWFPEENQWMPCAVHGIGCKEEK